MKQNEIEIPIYRAKLNIEDLARGNNIEDYLHKVIRHYVNRETIMKDGDNYYAIGRLNYYNEIEVFDNTDKQILKFPYFENTISINFNDMTDSQGNKIFASLSADGKGASEVTYCGSGSKDDYKTYGYLYYNVENMSFEFASIGFYGKNLKSKRTPTTNGIRFDMNFRNRYKDTLKVIGIQE